ERMAVVVAPEDAARFMELAEQENLESTVVAAVQAEPRLVMTWNGVKVVDISREFLNSNGAEKHIDITPAKPQPFAKKTGTDFAKEMRALAGDLNVCSKRGLSERFDSTIGRGTVLMPFGGKYQQTPIQAMVHKVSVEQQKTDTVSYMAWGYNPYISEKSPYHGAYLAVVESVSKLIAAGAKFEDVYLTFQEYFEKPLRDGKRWGKPLSALLGAFKAQMDLGIAAIGGKDSMSGTFEQIDVPPTLVSFAVTTGDVHEVVTPEFKAAGHCVSILRPETDENGLPKPQSLLALFDQVTALMREGKVCAAYTPTFGGIAEAALKCCIGNGVGFAFDDALAMEDIFGYSYGAFLLETDEPVGDVIGRTTGDGAITYRGESLALSELFETYEQKLEPVFPCRTDVRGRTAENLTYKASDRPKPAAHFAKPRVLIPVFPGTNCEFDTAKALASAGAEPEIFVINNLTAAGITRSVEIFADKLENAQIVFIPGGFSGGDEPDGSGKFITAFFRNARIKEGVTKLLEARDGLMCGVCNGFQALIKLGLVPYGEIVPQTADSPTLAMNNIGRHISKSVYTKVVSNLSPWLKKAELGGVYSIPASHGEGRFVANDEWLSKLLANGQIATQYVDEKGNPTMVEQFNPNGSYWAIEGITSPDGRVLGKMAHSERRGTGVALNINGDQNQLVFESGVAYFKD
ncbi:MAG: phosphoribosylformylglycinamidine synthase subunit PurQ, partial [Lachnospiraceae bacterium]|nr:phosphoribosylformylglycinamidine synthase subunit PurQ [Lachnospiraceae bacterium]